jgi:hypothetical protein
MRVEALTMSAQAVKPAEGPCCERHVLSVVMENKALRAYLSRPFEPLVLQPPTRLLG